MSRLERAASWALQLSVLGLLAALLRRADVIAKVLNGGCVQ